MEVTKEALLSATDLLELSREEIEAIDEPTFQIVRTSILHESLSTIRNLSKENKEQKQDLKTLLKTSNKIGKMIDLKKPMKAIANITKLVNNPGELKEEMQEAGTIFNKYNDKQITDGQE